MPECHTLDEVEKLVRLCRESGITELTVGSTTIKLSAQAAPKPEPREPKPRERPLSAIDACLADYEVQ